MIKPKDQTMVVELLSREHRNIEKLLLILEHELGVFERGKRPDFEVVWAVICYFKVYPQVWHHPQEDMVFKKLRARDPAAAADIGDLAAEHRKGAEGLRRVVQAVESALRDPDVLLPTIDSTIRDFIANERRHIAMEERDFFPAAIKALQPQDWAEITSTLRDQKHPLFSASVEARFDAVRQHILQLEQEAEAERG